MRETEEDRTQYQIDTCVSVKRFLEATRPNVGSVARQQGGGTQPCGASVMDISEFLGTHNWSKSTVANLLKIHRDLHPETTLKQENKTFLSSRN